jgi:hypothetical protein
VYGTETNAANLLNYLKVILPARVDGGLGVVTRNMNRECYQLTPLSLGLFGEKAVRLNVAAAEETVIVVKETVFLEVSVVELLVSHSVILMHEEPAGLDRNARLPWRV